MHSRVVQPQDQKFPYVVNKHELNLFYNSPSSVGESIFSHSFGSSFLASSSIGVRTSPSSIDFSERQKTILENESG